MVVNRIVMRWPEPHACAPMARNQFCFPTKAVLKTSSLSTSVHILMSQMSTVDDTLQIQGKELLVVLNRTRAA
jgi:hypothetical protein